MKFARNHTFQDAKIWIIFQILFFLAYHSGFSQSSDFTVCGTPDLSDYLDESRNIPYIQTRSEDTRYYAIQLHSVGTSKGEGHIPMNKMLEYLCTLNDDFRPYGIQFFQKNDIKYINNDSYYEHNQSDGFRMMNNNNVRDAFNVYIVENPNEVCGYFSPSSRGIAIAKNCFIGSTHTLTHEMGHFLGLQHTFNGWENKKYDPNNVPKYISIRGRDTFFVETVAGKNCDKAGDFICDTPPDYNSERWNCDGEGLSLKTYVDPDGIEFRADGTNFMSYSQDNCMSRFTRGQVDRMNQVLNSEYKSHEYQFIPPEIVEGGNMSITSPENGTDIDFKNIRLQWKNLPDAVSYIIEVSRIPGISFDKDPNLIIIETSETEIFLPAEKFNPDRVYYWRVIPTNAFTLCLNPSGIYSFIPRVETNTQLLPDGDQFRMYPNLISGHQSEIQLDFSFSGSREVVVRLTDLNGRILRVQKHKIVGDVRQSFETGHLATGMYLMQFQLDRSVFTQKLIVQ